MSPFLRCRAQFERGWTVGEMHRQDSAVSLDVGEIFQHDLEPFRTPKEKMVRFQLSLSRNRLASNMQFTVAFQAHTRSYIRFCLPILHFDTEDN